MYRALVYFFLRGARKERLPLVVYRGLVDQLFGTYGSFAAGVVCGVIGGAVSYARTGKPEFLACMLATFAISAVRCAIMVAYRSKDRSNIKIREVVSWEAAYGIFGSWIFMAVLGGTAALAVFDGDIIAVLYTSLIVVGSAGAMAGRNAGRRRIVFGQVVASCFPLSAALVATGQMALAGIAFMVLMHFLSIMSYTKSLYATLRSALVGSVDNERLAETLKGQNLVVDNALNHMSHGLCMFDAERRVAVTNERFSEFFGDAAKRVGKPAFAAFADVAARMSLDGRAARDFAADCDAAMSAKVANSFTVEDGEGRHFEFRFNDDERGGHVVVVDDVTERKAASARIEHMAHFDSLTGLPNRFRFRERLTAAFASDTPFAVLVADLDMFKEVNDTLGHPIGDALLKEVASRFSHVARERDMVSRFGGDEFAVLVNGAADYERIAKRYVDAISAPYFVEGHHIVIGVSIGIAVGRDDGRDADVLFKNGDMALYGAKAAGRGVCMRFLPEMDSKMRDKRAMEADLRYAVSNDELELHYQPIVDARTRSVTACEALVRWRHPKRGLVSPLEFIAIAEETGVIVEIGEWVLNKACADAAAWPEHVRVAVNFSAAQFRRGDVVASISKALVASGLAANRLEVEITESMLMQDTEACANAVLGISKMGVRLALDDFSTGFSGLSYLNKFPFDKIKIDRSFIRDIATNKKAAAIVSGMAQITNILEKTLVCEGVETREQFECLAKFGVAEIQGYLFSKPVPVADVVPMMQGALVRHLRVVNS